MNNLVFMPSYTYESLWVRCPELGLKGKSAVISIDTANEHAHSSQPHQHRHCHIWILASGKEKYHYFVLICTYYKLGLVSVHSCTLSIWGQEVWWSF